MSRSRYMRVLLVTCLASLPCDLCWAESETHAEGIEWTEDFESGQPKPGWKWLVCNDSAITVVTEASEAIPAVGGTSYLRTLRQAAESGPGKQYCQVRAELMKENIASAKQYQETWVGVQLFVPESWDPTGHWSRVLQWHAIPDKAQGEPFRNPPFSLAAEQNRWTIAITYDPRQVTPQGERNGGSRLFRLAMVKSKWTTWVFHWKWSYEQDGLFEAWQDGVQVVSDSGPNAHNDNEGPHRWQMGNYMRTKSSPILSPLVIYHDNLVIGNADSGFDAVAPPVVENHAKGRQPLYFREDWKETPAETPVTQAHVASAALILSRHGPAEAQIKKSHHDEIPNDPWYVWSGLCRQGHWAVSLHKNNELVDLSDGGRVRLRTKQAGKNLLHVILELADGTWLVSDRGFGATPDWHTFSFDLVPVSSKSRNVQWRKLDIKSIEAKEAVAKPDLRRVRSIGWTDLTTGKISKACTRVDWIEVYGRTVARKRDGTQ